MCAGVGGGGGGGGGRGGGRNQWMDKGELAWGKEGMAKSLAGKDAGKMTARDIG